MENFYVFLDIDGVLNTASWFKKVNKLGLESLGYSKHFSPQNVQELQYFLDQLKELKLEPNIVISSTHRINGLQRIADDLNKNGLNYNLPYASTNTLHNQVRGMQIADYINENKSNKNFVVIDDETVDITGHIPQEHILKTSGFFNDGLTKKEVDLFLNTFPFSTNQPTEVEKEL